MSSQPLHPPPPPSSSGSTSVSNPLDSLQGLLDKNTPHLQHLHSLIDLPPHQLALDLSRIEDAVKREMDAIISQRTQEADEWKTKVEHMRKECVSIGRALGAAVDVSGWMQSEPVLPRRYALLERYRDTELMPVYQQRIADVTMLNDRLSTLAKILPPTFNLTPTFAPPLHPKARVPSGAASTASTSIPRYALGLGLPSSSSSSKLAQEAEQAPTNVWEDASESRIRELESLVQRGEAERISLLSSLRELLFHLLDLLPEVDLSIPLPYPLPSTVTSKPTTPLSPTPLRAAAPQSEEERSYYVIVENLVSWADELPDEIDPRDLEQGGLDGVEPTPGLMDWVESVTEQIRALKTYREGQIQQIYDDLEPLWARLNIDPEHITDFVETHRGSSEETVSAYRSELARMNALKVQFMEQFVTAVRQEILVLQDELLLGEDEREAFGAFWDGNYSDELLLAHERECARLQEEADSKRELLRMVAKWQAIENEERDLLEASKDPSRLTGRGRPGQMLAEERARKRVEQLKPKLEKELLVLLPQWETSNSRAFMVNGERVLEIIQTGIDAKLEAIEARKRSRSGPSATSAPTARSHTPASSRPSASSRPTPRTAAPTPSTIVKRKDAPTPLTLNSKSGKLPRATPATATRPAPSHPRMAQATPCRLPQPQGHARNFSTASSVFSSTSSAFNVFGAGGRTFSSSTAATSVSGYSGAGAKVKAPMHVRPNPRRESFKPRASIAPVRGMGGGGGWSSPISEGE